MASIASTSTAAQPPQSVSGVQLAQGIGAREAKSFWADAWEHVVSKPRAVAAMAWLSLVTFFACFAPLLASGHPLLMRELDAGSASRAVTSPLLSHLRAPDVALALGAMIAVPWIFLGGAKGRSGRVGAVVLGGILAGVIIVISNSFLSATVARDQSGWVRWLRGLPRAGTLVGGALGVLFFLVGMAIPAIESLKRRLVVTGGACLLGAASVALTWGSPLTVFDYTSRATRGEVSATYTIVPFSPGQRFSALDRQPPMTNLGEVLEKPAGDPARGRIFWMGTDAFGQDVLTQMLSACRLAISIGLVSTGIAVFIGVTMGALMGYFGGWIDLLLFRVVEIFMAVPVLFLMILAAAMFQPSVYGMMAIVGLFSWTGAARFTRAEFLKLRNQDFVQSAKSVGLPLRSVLFKHMLPNGVTPVLVDASFAIAAAISIEATLSYLGLGPAEQASWGKLLASAVNSEGQFKWWLAVFPGAAIFLTVLAYNILGETLRDAIDPKLKKARV